MEQSEREQSMIRESAAMGYRAEEAERCLIGDIVSEYDKCAHIAEELRPEDFYFADHKTILRAVKEARAAGLAIDIVTIDQQVQKIDPARAAGILSRLIECMSQAAPWYAESHARVVKELAARRRAISMVENIRASLKDPAQSLSAILETMRAGADAITTGNHEWRTMHDILISTYEYIDQRSRGEIKSITSGISSLDRVIGGFFGGELTVIGARPAVGKSVFGMNVALAAAKAGFKVGICSREMTDIQYGQRVLSYQSGVDGANIRRAEITDSDWIRLGEALSPLEALNIGFLFTVRTVDDLRAEVQRKHNRGEIDMLIVDYLQLMETAQRFKEDRLRIGYISKALKDISVDFKIPVIALAQVKRFAGGARAKMPSLEDLKDSGSIEQDADNVIFLHAPYDRDDEFVDPRDREYFESYISQGYTYLCIGVAKQRQGVTGKCCVLFDKGKMRYTGIDRTGVEPI